MVCFCESVRLVPHALEKMHRVARERIQPHRNVSPFNIQFLLAFCERRQYNFFRIPSPDSGFFQCGRGRIELGLAAVHDDHIRIWPLRAREAPAQDFAVHGRVVCPADRANLEFPVFAFCGLASRKYHHGARGGDARDIGNVISFHAGYFFIRPERALYFFFNRAPFLPMRILMSCGKSELQKMPMRKNVF